MLSAQLVLLLALGLVPRDSTPAGPDAPPGSGRLLQTEAGASGRTQRQALYAVGPSATETREPKPTGAAGVGVSVGNGGSQDSAAHSDDTPHPPALVAFVEAVYPEGARAQRLEADVVLLLEIDATGVVTGAHVQRSAGHGFDEAALAAATAFRFSPARLGTTATACRIAYTYGFRLPETPAPGGDVRGAVRTPGGRSLPAAGVAVTLRLADGRRLTTQTDEFGEFFLEDVPAGGTHLQVDSLVGESERRFRVVAGETRELRIVLTPPATAAIEVAVVGDSIADRRRKSSDAVTVIETEEVKRETADLGEVLARTQGVGVRRAGGLGSTQRLSINGLTDDQVRFFADGIPLELTGYPFGLANVPLNIVDRVDVYKGVVPVRLGADALGGAVELTTLGDPQSGFHGGMSYQSGSFGTHRLTLDAYEKRPETGLYARAVGFYDGARNDYPVDVEVSDERGQLAPARVRRFHDAYRARGGSLDIGVIDRPWARKLLLRAFATAYDKELQHNLVMTVPYGDVRYGAWTAGGNLRYEHVLSNRVSVSVVGGYAYARRWLLDVGECVYSWRGQCVRERARAGEIDGQPRDRAQWDHSPYARIGLGWQLHPMHAVRLTLAPTYLTRTGDERRQSDPSARDPLTARRELFTGVAGIEHELDALGDRLENVSFAKYYLQNVRSEEPVTRDLRRDRDRTTHAMGIGSALRFRFVEWLWAKASYEWATRLPRPDEVFGDGQLIVDNVELEPERSHNANVGLTLDLTNTLVGSWRLGANGFLRETDNLIVLLGNNDQFFAYQNVFAARSIGVEAAGGWTSLGQHVELDANVTFQEFRNQSEEGTFGDFEGDRIPNRPYLFANASGRLQWHGVAVRRDNVSLKWSTRYVHAFFRTWESVGLRDSKQTIGDQLLHAFGLTYRVDGDPLRLSVTAELQNVTSARAFDVFGVQRPGRAFYSKTTLQF